jgi:alcohol dehydrogenase class IV
MLSPVGSFSNHLPVRIRFGDGAVAGLGEAIAGAGRVLVVSDPVVASMPSVQAALASLAVGDRTWTKEPGEPTHGEVARLASRLREAGADAIVAIGGGSVMDLAKAARLVAGQGEPIGRFARREVAIVESPTPLVLVPTTAGTGSEVSGGAVLTDEATHRKAGIASPHLRATAAIVDPELTYGLPPAATAMTGIDALAQAIAAMVVQTATPIGDAVALEAIRLGWEALPAAVGDGSDTAARSRMAAASLLGGLTMNISDCGSEHSLGQAIGGRYGLPHGLTIGLVLAETMDVDRRGAASALERIADAMGAPDDGSRDGSRAVEAVRSMLRAIAIPTMSEAGVREEDVDALATDALDDYFITVAPEPWTRDDVSGALLAGLALRSR